MGGIDTLPVTDAYGRLIGTVSFDDLRPLLNRGSSELELVSPVREWMRPPGRTRRPEMTVEEVRAELAESAETLFIVDSNDRLVGAIGLADLLSPIPVMPRPR